MSAADLQEQCELGQGRLMAMDYLSAEAILADAAQQALSSADYDLFSRVLLPLQEARRQRRQRCGEGTVCLDLISHGPDAPLDAEKIVDAFPSGQLLVAGWGSIQPALEIRRLQRERGLYLDTSSARAANMGRLGRRAFAQMPASSRCRSSIRPTKRHHPNVRPHHGPVGTTAFPIPSPSRRCR